MVSTNHIIFGNLIGAFQDSTQDKSKSGLCRVRIPGLHGPQVSPEHLAMVPRLLPYTEVGERSFDGYPDPGASCMFQQAYPGANFGTIVGGFSEFPKMGQSPGGTNDLIMSNLSAPSAIDPVNQPLPYTRAFKPPKDGTREGGVKIKEKQTEPYIPMQQANYKPHHKGFETVPWDQKKGIPTAITPASSSLGAGLLSSLPGQIMSLAQSFANLGGSQKSKIQNSVTPEVYNMIEAAMASAIDVGDTSTVSIVSRVDEPTLANNMVDMLCQCQNYADVISVMAELRANTALQGKDKIPTIEFPTNSLFGPTGIIIDAYGEITANVPSEVANSQAAFTQFISQGTNTYELIATFYGNINGTTLTVNQINTGQILIGPEYMVEGFNVTDGTFITGGPTTGGTGLYTVNLSSAMPVANSPMSVYRSTVAPEVAPPGGGGGGGGGLGGLIGMLSGQNMFGEASKLLGEIMPVLDPQSSSKVKSVLQEIQGHNLKALTDVATHKGKEHMWSLIGGV